MAKSKAENNNIPLVYLMMITVFYHFFLIFVYSILLVGFELEDDILDVLVVCDENSGFRSDGDLILDRSHEFLEKVVRINVELIR